MAVPVGPEAGSYLVQTLEKECEDSSFAARMQVELGKLPGQPTAEWTRPLNRRLQRLFGWGDVAATSDDLRHAARTGNVEQLLALMPQAACLIRGNKVEFEQLPALRDVLNGDAPVPLALEAAPFAPEEEKEDALPLRVVHEALGQHTWSERPNPKAKCSHCENWGPFECDCGIRLCEQCQLPPADSGMAPRYDWRQHPTEPMPFFVIDYAKWPESEKLVWIRQEIGNDADLEEFSEKWHELFSGKFSCDTSQRAACLKLYGAYVPPEEAREHKVESSLPPDVLQGFQRVFNPGAPERCWECGRASAPMLGHPIRYGIKTYCSTECERHNNHIVCRNCKNPACEWYEPAPGCRDRKPQFEPGPSFSYWSPWNDPANPAAMIDYCQAWPWARYPMSSAWQRVEDRKRKFLWFKAHFFENRPPVDHEPAWKRRRRS